MTATTANDDLLSGLAALGLRASKEALLAFLTHAHKSRLGPTQTLEEFVALERRSREVSTRVENGGIMVTSALAAAQI